MILYSCIVLPVALIIIAASISIYKGKTELIHSYHQTNVTDKASYGRAFGKALSVVGAGIFLSGIIALAGDSDKIILTAVAVMFAGMFAGFFCIYKVQKKYNGGVF